MLTNALSLGGIEKTAIAFARTFDPKVFEVHIGSFATEGPRKEEAVATGLMVKCFQGEKKNLGSYLKEHGILAIHSHEQGTLTANLFDACEDSPVRCIIQSNVFSLATPQDSQFDRQLFISMTNLIKYQLVNNLPFDFKQRAVLYNPIDFRRLDALQLTPSKRVAIREQLGLKQEHFVIGKIARKTLGKWSDLNLDSLAILLKEYPHVRLLVLGMPDSRWRLAKRMKISHAIVRVPETVDLPTLASYYQVMDTYTHFSKIGECCSAAIQEAMTYSLPVVTNSTPFTKQHYRYIDNGQIEQIEPGQTGFIASTPQSIAKAVGNLIEDAELRHKFGRSGRTLVEQRYDMPTLTRYLEKATLEILVNKGVNEAKAALSTYSTLKIHPTETDVLAYASRYPDRSRIPPNTQLNRRLAEIYRNRVRNRLRAARDLISIRQGWED